MGKHVDGMWCENLRCSKCYGAEFHLKHATPEQPSLVACFDEDCPRKTHTLAHDATPEQPAVEGECGCKTADEHLECPKVQPPPPPVQGLIALVKELLEMFDLPGGVWIWQGDARKRSGHYHAVAQKVKVALARDDVEAAKWEALREAMLQISRSAFRADPREGYCQACADNSEIARKALVAVGKERP